MCPYCGEYVAECVCEFEFQEKEQGEARDPFVWFQGALPSWTDEDIEAAIGAVGGIW